MSKNVRVSDEDQAKIQMLLNKKQVFFKKAFESLQKGDNKMSSTFFSIESSYTNSIATVINKYVIEEIKEEPELEVQETTSEDVNVEDEEETIG